MKYYLIAGEASGDLHGSFLMRALKQRDPDARFRYYGGDKMQAEGGELVSDYREGAIMGFATVLFHLPAILRRMNDCKRDIAAWRPDVVILIDYPGFNLRIARYLKQSGLCPVYYYIPPKVWAWKERRVKKIRRYVDRIFCIFPFEVDFYAKHGCVAEYVGNPSVDSVSHATTVSREDFLRKAGLPDKPIVALLPGSRRQEVRLCLPTLLALNRAAFPQYQLVLAATSSLESDAYKDVDVPVVWDCAYELLQHAEAAVVNSGTATLETALLNVPEVVCYQLPAKYISYPIIYGMLLKIKYVSLVNIIAGKEVVRELLAYHLTPKALEEQLHRLLEDPDNRRRMLDDYAEIRRVLTRQVASESAAEKIVSALR